MNKNVILSVCFALAMTLSGCGQDYAFKKAEKIEKQGDYKAAVAEYSRFLEKYPDSQMAAQAQFAIASIQYDKFRDYAAASKSYETIITKYPQSPYVEQSKKNVSICSTLTGLAAKEGWAGFKSLITLATKKNKGSMPELDASAIQAAIISSISEKGNSPDAVADIRRYAKMFPKGRYFLSTMPATWAGRNPELMGKAIAFSKDDSGEVLFKLYFNGFGNYPGRPAICSSRIEFPAKRYQDFLLRYEGTEVYTNAYGEKETHPTFRVLGVCGWNSYGETRNSPVLSYDDIAVRELLD